MLPDVVSPAKTEGFFNQSMLSFLLGFRDIQPLIAKATQEDQLLAQNLQTSHADYAAHPNDQSVRSLHEALTAAIDQLEREHATALENVQSARKQQSQTSMFSLILNALIGGGEEQHYTAIADKVASRLQALCLFRDSLIVPSIQEEPSHTSRRLLLQAASTLPPQKTHYFYPSGISKIDQIRNGVSGFLLKGDSGVVSSGFSVGTAGDVNGDGFSDFVIGSQSKTHVVFGSANNSIWGNGTLSLTSLIDGQRGFVLQFADLTSGSTAGDINGDGFADVMVTGRFIGLGQVCILFGSNSRDAWGNGTLDVSLFDGERGVILQGEAGGEYAVGTAGDFNGDGFSDFMVGTKAAGPTGKVYILFGTNSSDAWGDGDMNLTSLMDGQRGFVLQGAANDELGQAVTAGDINGDGLADVVVSTTGDRLYVIFGSNNSEVWATGSYNITSFMDGQRGFSLQGEEGSASFLGLSVSCGDVNGDGLADVIVGSAVSKALVIFGSDLPNAWGTGSVSQKNIMNGKKGFVMRYQSTASFTVMVTAGDFNGDGVDDVMAGISLDDSAGQAFIVYGSTLASAWGTGVVDLLSLEVNRGFVFDGEAPFHQLGRSVGTAGDINGDGLVDMILGAFQADTNKGRTYVAFGRNLNGYFTANNLQIAADRTVNMTLQNLNISDYINSQFSSRSVTQFIIENVGHGYFSMVSAPNAIINEFSMQELMAGRVQFVHTGGAVAPQYRLCVALDLLGACSDGQVDFLGYPPTLINNELAVNQGGVSVLQASDLSASDQDASSPSQLTFIVDGLRHGYFTVFDRDSNTTKVSKTFTQQAVLDGSVRFVHNGTRDKPAYTVVVNDTKSATKAYPATITFTYEPELRLTGSWLMLDQGQATTLRPQDINASDVETFQGLIIIEVAENVTAGYFAYASNLNFSITAFQQLSLITGGVQFVQDGSDVVPSFSLRAFDGVLRSPWQSPRIGLNRRPVLLSSLNNKTATTTTHVEVTQGEDFHFTLESVRFSDPEVLLANDDDNSDTSPPSSPPTRSPPLQYRAQLKGVGTGGGSPLPPEIRFTAPDQFSGNLPSVGSYNIEVQASDARGVTSSTDFILASVVPKFDVEKLYTALSTVLGVGATMLAYLWLRRRIAIHRRKFPFLNDLRKTLNLEYYDFTRFDGDAYKTKVLKLQWDLEDFYAQLSVEEQKSFAVCVAEIMTKRGLVCRSGSAGGLFGLFCLLNVGWPNELDLGKFEVQSKAIAAEAVANWTQAQQEGQQKEHLKPLNRWAYLSPSSMEKFKVCCCCAKPSSADRWRPTDDYYTNTNNNNTNYNNFNNSTNNYNYNHTNQAAVALTELKTREGDE